MVAAAICLAPLALAAAWSDLRHRRVSNRLNLAIFAGGLGWRVVAAIAAGDALIAAHAFTGAAVGLALLFVPFAVRWVGGGDVKLLAAFGAWLGPADAALVGLYGLAGGGAWAVVMMATDRSGLAREVARTLRLSVATLSAPAAPRRRAAKLVPLAVPLAVAACAVLFVRGLS